MVTNGNQEPFNLCTWLNQLSSSKKASITSFLGIGILAICLFSSDTPLIWKFTITGFFLVLFGLFYAAFINNAGRR